LPPNTDNLEWWSLDTSIPELPIIDYPTLRNSANTTHTLNVYGCASSTVHTDSTTGNSFTGKAPWDARSVCASTETPHNLHFGNTWNHHYSPQFQPNTDYVWYWDSDVTLTGDSTCASCSGGLRGTMIVKGNLYIDTPGQYSFTASVPPNAWKQHLRSTINTYDSSASGEYPADTGLHQNSATFAFGSTTWCLEPGMCGLVSTPGFRGFVYVDKDLHIQNATMDIYGSVWVNGSVYPYGTGLNHGCGIFFNNTLALPTLNVILMLQSWQEVPPSTTAWQ
jgi:hypothetical protein